MITEDYVSFEIAKILKEKGFEQESDYATSWYANQYYKNSCQGEWFEGEHQIIEDIDDKCNISYLSERGIFIPAPTLQMAMKWLREKGWVICVIPLTFYCGEKVSSWGYNIWADDNLEINEENSPKFISYEDACGAAIKYCLEHLI